MTGIEYYNCSVPGASFATSAWTNSSTGERTKLVTNVAPALRDGTNIKVKSSWEIPKNTQTYADFDVILLAAGTNDYRYDSTLGSVNDTKPETFYGAINTFMGYIQAASDQR